MRLIDTHYPKCEIDALALQSRLESQGFVVLVEKTNGSWIVYVHEIRRRVA